MWQRSAHLKLAGRGFETHALTECGLPRIFCCLGKAVPYAMNVQWALDLRTQIVPEGWS
jgi:hypothetical protein